MACGSEACAAAVAAYDKGLCSLMLISQIGVLHIDIQKDAIIQTGHAEIIFKADLQELFLLD